MVVMSVLNCTLPTIYIAALSYTLFKNHRRISIVLISCMPILNGILTQNLRRDTLRTYGDRVLGAGLTATLVMYPTVQNFIILGVISFLMAALHFMHVGKDC